MGVGKKQALNLRFWRTIGEFSIWTHELIIEKVPRVVGNGPLWSGARFDPGGSKLTPPANQRPPHQTTELLPGPGRSVPGRVSVNLTLLWLQPIPPPASSAASNQNQNPNPSPPACRQLSNSVKLHERTTAQPAGAGLVRAAFTASCLARYSQLTHVDK